MRPRLSEMPSFAVQLGLELGQCQIGLRCQPNPSLDACTFGVPARQLAPGLVWHSLRAWPVRFRCAEIFFPQPTLTRNRSASFLQRLFAAVVGQQKLTTQIIPYGFAIDSLAHRVSPKSVYTITRNCFSALPLKCTIEMVPS